MTAAVTRPETMRTGEPLLISDEQLRALTADERVSLARRLELLATEAASPGAVEPPPVIFPRRRWFLGAVAVACLSLVGWIVLLSQTLPSRYVVGHWDAAWIGFDMILLLSMATVGVAAWRRPAAVPFAALVTAVLLICDAWFDVSTATGSDTAFSAFLAAVLELPLAVAMLCLAYRRLLRRHGDR